MSALRVVGLRECLRALDGFADDLEDLQESHDALGQQIAREAAGIVPVRSGALRATIRPVRAAGKAAVTAGGGGAPYALVIDRRVGFLRSPGNDETTARRLFEDGISNAANKHNLT